MAAGGGRCRRPSPGGGVGGSDLHPRLGPRGGVLPCPYQPAAPPPLPPPARPTSSTFARSSHPRRSRAAAAAVAVAPRATSPLTTHDTRSASAAPPDPPAPPLSSIGPSLTLFPRHLPPRWARRASRHGRGHRCRGLLWRRVLPPTGLGCPMTPAATRRRRRRPRPCCWLCLGGWRSPRRRRGQGCRREQSVPPPAGSCHRRRRRGRRGRLPRAAASRRRSRHRLLGGRPGCCPPPRPRGLLWGLAASPLLSHPPRGPPLASRGRRRLARLCPLAASLPRRRPCLLGRAGRVAARHRGQWR